MSKAELRGKMESVLSLSPLALSRCVFPVLLDACCRTNRCNTSIGEPLHIDYVNKEAEEDDIVICGNNCTIFLDDLKDCIIIGKTIFIDNKYAIHLK